MKIENSKIVAVQFLYDYLHRMDTILKLLKSGVVADEKAAFTLLETKDRQYFKVLLKDLKKKGYGLYIIERVDEMSRLAR